MDIRDNKEIEERIRNTVDWICENGPVVRDGITELEIEERLWKLIEECLQVVD